MEESSAPGIAELLERVLQHIRRAMEAQLGSASGPGGLLGSND